MYIVLHRINLYSVIFILQSFSILSVSYYLLCYSIASIYTYRYITRNQLTRKKNLSRVYLGLPSLENIYNYDLARS